MRASREWNRPELSEQARAAGVARRLELEEEAKAERLIESLQSLINKINRRMR